MEVVATNERYQMEVKHEIGGVSGKKWLKDMFVIKHFAYGLPSV